MRNKEFCFQTACDPAEGITVNEDLDIEKIKGALN